jgi:hypothetical protein
MSAGIQVRLNASRWPRQPSVAAIPLLCLLWACGGQESGFPTQSQPQKPAPHQPQQPQPQQPQQPQPQQPPQPAPCVDGCVDDVGTCHAIDDVNCGVRGGRCSHCAPHGLVCNRAAGSCESPAPTVTPIDPRSLWVLTVVSANIEIHTTWDTWIFTEELPDPYVVIQWAGCSASAVKIGKTSSNTATPMWQASTDKYVYDCDDYEALTASRLTSPFTLQIRDSDGLTSEEIGTCSVQPTAADLQKGSLVLTQCAHQDGSHHISRIELAFRRK